MVCSSNLINKETELSFLGEIAQKSKHYLY
jgi:hypothetical protein